MRILALETSAKAGMIAALAGNTLLKQRRLDAGRKTTQTLLPGVAALLDSVGWRAGDVQLVAVAKGPGSFTGLRVGITAAKTFAYTVGCEVIGVGSLEVIAAQSPGDLPRVCAVIDAQRQQLFSAQFHRGRGGNLRAAGQAEIVDYANWLDRLPPKTAVTGPGLSKLLDRLPAAVTVVPRRYWTPTAATVGRLGYRDNQSGRRDDVWNLMPLYCRKSAAEENRGSSKFGR